MATYAQKDTSASTNGFLGIIIGLAVAALIAAGIYMYYTNTSTMVTPPVTEHNVQVDVAPANEPAQSPVAPMTTTEPNTAQPPADQTPTSESQNANNSNQPLGTGVAQ